jgi:HPt (histidine-containing phosphotransfer) domain-containing protein
MVGARESYLDAGMSDYVSKPIVPADFLATVAVWAGGQPPEPHTPEDVSTLSLASAEKPLLDNNQLTAIESSIGRQRLAVLVEDYLAGTHARIGKITALILIGDLARAGREAHDLISTSGNFGARRLQAMACELEDACRADDRLCAAAIALAIEVTEDPSFMAMRHRFPAPTVAAKTKEAVERKEPVS